MPTRTAMVLSLNGRGSAGDPFLGALIRGGFAIAKGVFRKIAGRGRPAVTALARVQARLPAGALVKAGKIVAPAVAAGAAFEVGSRIVGFDAAGQPILSKRRRRRGITATELRGFRKVTSLLHRVGMTPRGLRGRIHHAAHH